MTFGPTFAQYLSVSANEPTSPLLGLLRWLAAHSQFPSSRLPAKSELLLILTAAAAAEEGAGGVQNRVQSRDYAKDAAMRAHALRRSMVHYKCDNSAKV